MLTMASSASGLAMRVRLCEQLGATQVDQVGYNWSEQGFTDSYLDAA